MQAHTPRPRYPVSWGSSASFLEERSRVKDQTILEPRIYSKGRMNLRKKCLLPCYRGALNNPRLIFSKSFQRRIAGIHGEESLRKIWPLSPRIPPLLLGIFFPSLFPNSYRLSSFFAWKRCRAKKGKPKRAETGSDPAGDGELWSPAPRWVNPIHPYFLQLRAEHAISRPLWPSLSRSPSCRGARAEPETAETAAVVGDGAAEEPDGLTRREQEHNSGSWAMGDALADSGDELSFTSPRNITSRRKLRTFIDGDADEWAASGQRCGGGAASGGQEPGRREEFYQCH